MSTANASTPMLAWDRPFTVDGRKPTQADATLAAIAEFKSNLGGCRAAFVSERAYVGYRTAILTGAYTRAADRA